MTFPPDYGVMCVASATIFLIGVGVIFPHSFYAFIVSRSLGYGFLQAYYNFVRAVFSSISHFQICSSAHFMCTHATDR